MNWTALFQMKFGAQIQSFKRLVLGVPTIEEVQMLLKKRYPGLMGLEIYQRQNKEVISL